MLFKDPTNRIQSLDEHASNFFSGLKAPIGRVQDGKAACRANEYNLVLIYKSNQSCLITWRANLVALSRPLCYTIFVLLIKDKEKINYLHIIFKELTDMVSIKWNTRLYLHFFTFYISFCFYNKIWKYLCKNIKNQFFIVQEISLLFHIIYK